jgi:hypothetical protein
VELTENWDDREEWSQPNSSNSNSNKKPMLSKKSRAFHMPSEKQRKVSNFAQSCSPDQEW